MMSAVPSLSVVIPCYNEQEVLPEMYRRLTAACAAAVPSYEVVLVNDGSSDGTWPMMLDLAARDPHVVLANLSRNHGHQLALSAGLSMARGERVLVLDADLQDPPELLPRMMALMDEAGADVVYGQRVRRAGETVIKRVTAAAFYRFIGMLTEIPIPRDTGDFRLMSRRALDVLRAMPERHRFVRGMVSWIGFKQVPLPYERDPRFAGVTKYPYRKLVRMAIDAVTAFSVKPLALASIVGFVAALLALLLVAFAVGAWIRGVEVPGWTSLMAGIAFFSSIQLFVLGIIGEYLGRLYEQSKGRPLFVIERVVRSDRADALDSPPTASPTPTSSSASPANATEPVAAAR
jgi:dolichol-phosphate mannosyltransferase